MGDENRVPSGKTSFVIIGAGKVDRLNKAWDWSKIKQKELKNKQKFW